MYSLEDILTINRYGFILKLFFLIEIIFMSMMQLLEMIFNFAEIKPVKNSFRHILLKNVIGFRLSFVFKGIKGCEDYLKKLLNNLEFRTSQSGRRDSTRNKYIREEFEIYKYAVYSPFFEEIGFESMLFGNVESKIEETRKKYYEIKVNNQEAILEQKKLSFGKIHFPDNLKVTRNAIIEYEYFHNKVYGNLTICLDVPILQEVIAYFGGKYAKSFQNLKDDTLHNISRKLTSIDLAFKNEKVIKESIKWTKQAIEIAVFFKKEKVKEALEARLSTLEDKFILVQ